MSARGLQALITTAITHPALQARILAKEPDAYAGFDLSASEVEMLCAIHADSLTDFARQAHYLFYGEDPAPDEPAAPSPRPQPIIRVMRPSN